MVTNNITLRVYIILDLFKFKWILINVETISNPVKFKKNEFEFKLNAA